MSDAQPTGEYEYRSLPIDEIRYDFEKAFRKSEAPRIDDYLQGDGPDRLHLLLELVHSELELRLRAGESAELSEYLLRYPALNHFPNEVILILETEVRLRQQSPTSPNLKDYEARYPQLAEKVREVFRRIGAAPPEVPGYELLETIGQGGMGLVYKARQVLLKREVALKVIRQDKLSDTVAEAKFRSRFRREAEAVASISHPNVIQIFDYGDHAGNLFIAMELIEGRTLQARLNSDGVLAPREAAELVEKLAHALQAVHDKQIVHRDLKPDNILLTRTGEPKVVDFGLARPAELEEGKTIAGVFIGTPEYSSPEQASMSGESPTPRIDVYGLGAILYAALTGRPPFVRESIQKTLERVRIEPVLPVREIRSNVPRDLETICLKCLEKDPAKRYAKAIALSEDLRRWLDGKPIVARPVGRVERGWKWVRRNRGVSISVSLVILSMLFGTTIAMWQASLARKQAGDLLIEQTRTQSQLEHAKVLDYSVRLSSAQQAYEDQHHSLALAYLDSCPSEQRGWEHDLLTTWITAGDSTVYHLGVNLRSVVFGENDQTICRSEWFRNRIEVVDTLTGIRKFTLDGHEGEVISIQMSPDRRQILTTSVDQTVRVWNARTGAQIVCYKGHVPAQKIENRTEEMIDARFVPQRDEVCSIGTSGEVHRWSIRTGKKLNSWRNLDAVSLAVSPSGAWVATGDKSGKIRLWNLTEGQEVGNFNGHIDQIACLDFSPDGEFLASGSWDRSVILWNVQTRHPVERFEGEYAVTRLAFSPDGNWLAAASSGGICMSGCIAPEHRIWDYVLTNSPVTRSGSEIRVWEVGASRYPGKRIKPTHRIERDFDTGTNSQISFSHNSRVLITSGYGYEGVRLVQMDRGNLTINNSNQTMTLGNVAPQRDLTRDSAQGDLQPGKELEQAIQAVPIPITESRDTYVALFRRIREEPAISSDPPAPDPSTPDPFDFRTLRIAPDGLSFCCLQRSGCLVVFETRTGDRLGQLEPENSRLPWLHFDFIPNSPSLLLIRSDGVVQRWNYAEQGQLMPVVHDVRPFKAIAISPNGQHFAGVIAPGSIEIRTVQSGELIRQLTVEEAIESIRFSSLGDRLATWGPQTPLLLWDYVSGDICQRISILNEAISRIDFSPDDRTIGIAQSDGTISLYSTQSCEKQVSFRTPGSAIIDLFFTADGRRVVANTGQILRIWDRKTGIPLVWIPLDKSDTDWKVQLNTKGKLSMVSSYRRESQPEERKKEYAFTTQFAMKQIQPYPVRDHLLPNPQSNGEFVQLCDFSAHHDGVIGKTQNHLEIWAIRPEKLLGRYRLPIAFENVKQAIVNSRGDRLAMLGAELGIGNSPNRFGIRIWDIETGKPLATYFPIPNTDRIDFSEDGRSLTAIEGARKRQYSTDLREAGESVIEWREKGFSQVDPVKSKGNTSADTEVVEGFPAFEGVPHGVVSSLELTPEIPNSISSANGRWQLSPNKALIDVEKQKPFLAWQAEQIRSSLEPDSAWHLRQIDLAIVRKRWYTAGHHLQSLAQMLQGKNPKDATAYQKKAEDCFRIHREHLTGQNAPVVMPKGTGP